MLKNTKAQSLYKGSALSPLLLSVFIPFYLQSMVSQYLFLPRVSVSLCVSLVSVAVCISLFLPLPLTLSISLSLYLSLSLFLSLSLSVIRIPSSTALIGVSTLQGYIILRYHSSEVYWAIGW
jgi:hypothetical protein